MDRLTRAEYKMLRKIAKSPRAYDHEQVRFLFNNNLIYYRDKEYICGIAKPTSNFYKITHEGQLVYEHYHAHIFERRMVSFRAWLALALSAVSIIVTIVHLFFF